MTDEQIIKNAEYHELGNCSQCDYKNYGSSCLRELLNDSIKMAKRLCDDVADFEEGYNDGIVIIGRLKAELKTAKTEIENLKVELKAMREAANSYKLELERKEDELHRAKVEISKHFDYMDSAANEAIKEFAERLKSISIGLEIGDDKKIKVMAVSTIAIDKIAKEMTEVQK